MNYNQLEDNGACLVVHHNRCASTPLPLLTVQVERVHAEGLMYMTRRSGAKLVIALRLDQVRAWCSCVTCVCGVLECVCH